MLDDADDHADFCPCARPFVDDGHVMDVDVDMLDPHYYARFLQQDNSTSAPTAAPTQETKLWEVIYTCGVLVFMFGALLSDKVGADSVMLISLTLFIVAGIITIDEATAGFSNEGLLTVMVLFVVASGISKTGALDWYMGKLLGRPKTAASAQLRLMLPISFVSAFLNNTPVVQVMIPIVQKWARNINISAQQLLIPLSFASILGGTCTIIGTSTNLVVVGLLQERFPDDPETDIGIFDLGIYGVPIAMVGIAYIVLLAPCLLPGGSRRRQQEQGTVPLEMGEDDILLGARITPWSPAAGRSVKRSGLRDTGGIYLVSVHRAATGNVHRAVGQEFILNVGDICYFTGINVAGFGDFCEEHGMEVLTNELQDDNLTADKDSRYTGETQPDNKRDDDKGAAEGDNRHDVNNSVNILLDPSQGGRANAGPLRTVVEGRDEFDSEEVPVEVGCTKESLMQADEAERSRSITRMIDLIRGVAREEPTEEEDHFLHPRRSTLTSPRSRQTPRSGVHKVVVLSEHGFVVVGVDARDRPGLLLDISKGLLRLNLTLRHSEASVIGDRSVSIWRSEVIGTDLPDLEEIWSVMNALLETETGSHAVKRRGLRVVRAIVTPTSFLVGKTANDVDFRLRYQAAIVAIQKGGKNIPLSAVTFGSGDVFVLQTSDDSPLMKSPPEDFYKRSKESAGGSTSRSGSVASFVGKLTKSISSGSLEMNQTSSNIDLGGKKKSSRNMNSNSSDQLGDLEDTRATMKAHGCQEQEVVFEKKGDGLDDFYVGGSLGESDDDVDAEYGNQVDQVEVADVKASLAVAISDEEVWKDLQVIFEDNRRGDDSPPAREFLSAMEIAPKSKLAGQTVAETGLDKLPGVFLVSIDRPTGQVRRPVSASISVMRSIVVDGHSLHEVASVSEAASTVPTVDPIFTTITPDSPLQEGDVLWFAGGAHSVGDLRKIPGMISYENEEVEKINEKIHDRRLVEAVIARRGPLAGKTVKEVRFRTRYGAAVLAVHREGKRIHEHPGKTKLQAGDVLLLEAGPTFIKGSADNDRAFSLLAEVEDSAPPRLKLLVPALVITVAMLAVATSGYVSLLTCGMVAAICMSAVGLLSEQEVRDALNWEVYMVIAAAFGIGTALRTSGVAGGVADFLVAIGTSIGTGSAALFGAVYLATFLISNIVTNNAAAALMFPIAMDAAEQTGTDVVLMSYCLMLGASASFMSPFGYTTNLLIYGPGGYKYVDFLAIGTPMQFVLWIVSIVVLETSTISNFYISWLAAFAALFMATFVMVCDGRTWIQEKGNKALAAKATESDQS